MPADAGTPGDTEDAGLDAGAPAPLAAELAIAVRASLPDGGSASLQLGPGTRPLIDPPASLELTLRPPLTNYRVRVFDDSDKVVESDDEAEDRPDQLEYRIGFLAPLETGRRYTLVLDAQTGETVTDRAGAKHPDQRLEFQISGEKEKPPARAAKPGKKKKKKKR